MSGTALTGGRVNYYLATVLFPQREDQPAYTAECEDIIAALKMDFNEACEFKAIWRTAAARLGNGKPGQKALYDAEKRLHYAGRSVAELRRTEQAEPDDKELRTMVWYKHTGNKMPEGVMPDDKVAVKLEDGSNHSERPAHAWDWFCKSNETAIKEFCITRRA